MAKDIKKITTILEQLLIALKSEESVVKPKKKIVKKRGRPKKEKVDDDAPYEQPEITEEIPLVSVKTRVKRKKNELKPASRSPEDKIRARTGRPDKGRGARRVPLTIPKNGRPNLFETSPDFNAHKDDVAIDKLLNKGKTPTPRISNGKIRTRVDIECYVCGDICSVHPDEISSEGRYRCMDCIGKSSTDDDYDIEDEDLTDDSE